MSNLNQRFNSQIWRKRDNQGNLIDNVETRDIFVPFKSFVPPGHSTFEIPVPRTYLNRIFSFDNLMMIPNMYMDQAAQFDLDTEEELDEILSYEIYLKVDFDPRNMFYPGVYVGIPGTKTIFKLARDGNIFFETKKPPGIKHLGGYFDWIDLRFENVQDEGFDAYMQSMAPSFYGEKYDPAKHYNALPQSARKIPGANNYLFPTEKSADVIENIRFRLNLAPNTEANFSTDGHLKNMGFNEQQIGLRNTKKQFTMVNEGLISFNTITADDIMNVELTVKPSDFKMYLLIHNTNFTSESNYVGLSRRDAMKNENYEIAIRNTLSQFEDQCNLQFGVTYSAALQKFTFLFPNNLNMRNMRIVLVPELSERLGFELHNEITEQNRVGHKIEDLDTKDTEDKARALAHDTGVMIVSDFSTNTNTTFGINERYMASLYPTESGTMVIHVNELCHEQPTMQIPDESMTQPIIPVTFLLSKYLENNELVNLVWKEGFSMQGTLRGVHPLKSKM